MTEIKNFQTDHFINPISYEKTKKIIAQMEKNVCIIKVDNLSGGGFFCKIPIHEKNDKVITALLTNNRFINENILNQKNKEIFITTKHQPKPKCIKLDRNERYIGRYQKYGITIIEIIEKDDIKDFFEIGDNNVEHTKTYINNKCIYMIHCKGKELYVSFGALKGMDTRKMNYFNHTCSCDNESLGSPIISLKTNKIIGIHTSNEKTYNKGILFNLADFSSSSKNIRCKGYESLKKSSTSNEIDYEYLMKNGLEISEKRGLCSFEDEQYSRLNSIIQMLTSIKEIDETINPQTIEEDYVSTIQKFNHIYPFTSFFHKALLELYDKPKKEGENPSLSKMNIFMKFINKDISKQRLYNYLMSILGLLHEELVNFPYLNIGKESLVSLNSPYRDMADSKGIFYSYYENTYQKSIISNLFNWIRREEKYCYKCQISCYSYQSFPILLLDLDDIDKFLIENKMYLNEKEKKLDLQSCLNIYSINNHINNNSNEFCVVCNANGGFRSTYCIDTSPPYFIIVLNRNQAIHFSYKDEFELPKDSEQEYVFAKYKLMGIILKEGTKFSCLIKNSEYKNKEGKIIEHWKKFSDDKVRDIKFEKNENAHEKQTDIFNPYNTRILLYKGVSSFKEFDETIQ